jgi:hypothetical protein
MDGQPKLAEGLFEKFGPNARYCIEIAGDERKLPSYGANCRAAALLITADSLRRFVFDCVFLDYDGKSDKIFTVRRNEVDNLEAAHVEPISAYVEMLLMTSIDTLQWLDRTTLYHTFARVDETRVVAGLLYKSLGRGCLAEGIILTLKPMMTRREQQLVHWKSQCKGHTSNFMDLPVDNSKTVYFPPNPEIKYDSKLTLVRPNQLYVPIAKNQVGFDSFFLLDTTLYIFKFTVENGHDIKEDIKESLSGYLNILPPKEDWCFVFITPPDCDVDVKANSAVERSLEGVKMYSAHLEIEQQEELNAGPYRRIYFQIVTVLQRVRNS